MEQHSRTLMNQLLPSKRNLYDVLEHAPEFLLKLPSINSKAVTINYLLGIANGQIYCIKKAEYNEFKRSLPYEKFDYFIEIKKYTQSLGFHEESLPDKTWLKNVLFSIRPNHPFFGLPALETLQISNQ